MKVNLFEHGERQKSIIQKADTDFLKIEKERVENVKLIISKKEYIQIYFKVLNKN